MRRVAVIGIVGDSAFLSVERFHTGGETVPASSVHFELGGKGVNQAVAAARMGAEVSFLAAVGKRDVKRITAFLAHEGICACPAPKEEPTAFAAILTDAEGANRVTVYAGAALSSADVEGFAEYIAGADVLLLSNEVPGQVNLTAARIAAANGTRILLNPAPARENDRELLDSVFLFTPNEHEGEGLEAYPNVIQTLGEKGCFIKSENKLVPPPTVEAVDTTGAGDTFNGVLAAALAEGKSVEEATALAVKASAISVTRRGVMDAIPYRTEL